MRANQWTRRDFVTTTSATALGMAVGLPAFSRRSQDGVMATHLAEGGLTLRDARVKALALRMLDAAHSAGAQYADVRMTVDTTIGGGLCQIDMGVRALVNGSWGFASSPYLAADEGPRLAKAAVEYAKSIAAADGPRMAEWAPIPVIHDGDWSTPSTIRPLTVNPQELTAFHNGLLGWAAARGITISPTRGDIGMGCLTQDRLFASTEGSAITQTIYKTSAWIKGTYKGEWLRLDDVNDVTAGWEYWIDNQAHVRDALLRKRDAIEEELKLPQKMMDIGRYDVAMDQRAVATLLSLTLGPATQLDRALGYEANEAGTSYLGPDPFAMLGTAVASPLLSLTADRSTPRGLATVKWDDEGVVPEPFPLIKNGMLVDYQTTREQAAWLAPYYEKHGLPVRSHGCAAAPSGGQLAMQHTPNLAMTPGTTELDHAGLVAGMAKGVEMISASRSDVDQQCLNGVGFLFKMFEVKGGRRVARVIPNLALLFRSPEIWKNIQTLGGPKSLLWIGGSPVVESVKGVPEQQVAYSIGAVPMLVKQMSLFDPTRK